MTSQVNQKKLISNTKAGKPASIAKKPDTRTRDLAMIHIAKSQLGLDNETYRSVILLISNNRTDSSAQLDYAERSKLIEHFKARGFKNKGSDKPSVANHKKPLIDKISALLTAQKLSWAYADGISKRMYNRARVQWCTPEELRGIIAALVNKCKK